jgi:hypothetical protein
MKDRPLVTRGFIHRIAAIISLLAVTSSLRAADAPMADAAKPVASRAQQKPAREAKRIKQGKDGSVVLQARDVVIHGTTVRYEPDKNTIGYWTKPADWVSWELEITRPDTFTVEMFEACGRGSGGSHYTVEIAGADSKPEQGSDQKLTDQVPDTDSFRNFRTRKIGGFKIEKPGNYTLSVHVVDKPGLAVMDLRTVTLKPPLAEKTEPAKTEASKPGATKGDPDRFQEPEGTNKAARSKAAGG